MQAILDALPGEFYPSTFTAADLVDLNYHWSYEIPFDDINSSFVEQDVALVLKPSDFQQELLKFTGEKFLFAVDNVASRLGIPAINLSNSYDPGDWETVVHAMISESALAFTERLQLPSVDALAQLVQIETQQLLNLNLSTFEGLVFSFPPKKVILDTNTTSTVFSSSGIAEASYSKITLTKVLTNEEIKLSLHEFSILYNKSAEQAKTIDRTTLSQIYRMCDIPFEAILNMTLPDASQKVVGSINQSSPCPVLIQIKGKAISSFQSDSVAITKDMTVLEILTTVTGHQWHAVRWAFDASLSDWEFLDSVTLLQLAEISGYEVEALRNESVSESVKLIFALRENNTLDNKTEAYRAFIGGVLKESFNLSFSEVATSNEVPEGSLQNASSAFLFKSFFNATVTYFKLNLSDIISAVQVTEEQLYNLPRQKWNNTISVIIDAVVTIEAANLQMPTERLFQLLGYNSGELSIAQLKELIITQIHDVKQKKMKFENDPISWYLDNNSVSDADYLNSSVLSLLLSASGFTSDELKLVYNLNSDQLFILGGMKFSDLPRLCDRDTSATKDMTPYNITAELTGIKASSAGCTNTRFYVEARHKNMSYLQTAFSAFANSSISFVDIVETVTKIPWRQNVWAFGLKMEDWTVLNVLNQDTFKEVSGITAGEFMSKTLLQVFESSVQLQSVNDQALRVKVNQNRGPTLNILYGLFNTNEDELIQYGNTDKAHYDVLLPIEVVPLLFEYLEAKFNVSLKSLEAALNLQPGNLGKLSPTEWPEMIPPLKAEIIQSGQQQLGVTPQNFAMLLQETSDSLQGLTLAEVESKWDNAFSRLLKGKNAMEKESVLQIINSIGIANESLHDVTVLEFVENRINLTKSELLLLYNFSSIGIEVLRNYTFVELPIYCEFSMNDLFNKLPYAIIVSMLGHNGDLTCRKVALVVAAATIPVDELATKFNFEVKNNISLLMMFEDLFQLPWPKIVWAVNASFLDWPILGAISLNDVATLTSVTADNIKLLKSFREITEELLALPSNSYASLLNDYRTELVNKAFSLFNINSSQVCDDCNVLDILWNSLTQLNLRIDFDRHILPNELNVSLEEFKLILPSRWSLLVLPIVKDGYSRAAKALGMNPDRLSILIEVPTESIHNMSLKDFQAVLEQSIQPFIDAKTALTNSSLMDLAAANGTNLTALQNESIFHVIDLLLNVPIENLTFIFNWTAHQQAKLKNYTVDDMAYYKGVGLLDLGNKNLLTFVNLILTETLPPRTASPPTLAPCKPGLARVSEDAECTDVNECSSGTCGTDSQCQNYHGGFDCECEVPGHFKVNADEKCKPCKTFRGALTVTNKIYRTSHKDKSTESYFDFKKDFETTVNEEFKKSSVKQFYYGCRVNNLRNGSIVVDYLIFTSPEYTGSIQDLQNALTERLNNSHLGALAVKTPVIEDFDECETHQDDCGQHATCVNTDGSFDCTCDDGYDGDGRTCEAGFFKTMWWTVIVAAFLLLIVVIIVVCLVIKRPKPSARYGLETDDSLQQNQPYRRNSEASKVSYRSGDVYYKDKDGIRRPGTAHSSHAQESGRPHPPHFVGDDDYEPNGRMRAKTPFELVVEKNSRNGNVYEDQEQFNMSELPSSGANGTVNTAFKD
ncbi:hypothetical protein ACROYT_G026261 [Oculina patagonica]